MNDFDKTAHLGLSLIGSSPDELNRTVQEWREEIAGNDNSNFQRIDDWAKEINDSFNGLDTGVDELADSLNDTRNDLSELADSLDDTKNDVSEIAAELDNTIQEMQDNNKTAVHSSSSSVASGNLPVFDGTTGKTIKDSGFKIGGTNANGAVWGYIPVVKTDGGIELGKYIDLHLTSNDGIDRFARIVVSEDNGTPMFRFEDESSNLSHGKFKNVIADQVHGIHYGTLGYPLKLTLNGTEFEYTLASSSASSFADGVVFYAPKTSGTSNQILLANTDGEPSWADSAPLATAFKNGNATITFTQLYNGFSTALTLLQNATTELQTKVSRLEENVGNLIGQIQTTMIIDVGDMDDISNNGITQWGTIIDFSDNAYRGITDIVLTGNYEWVHFSADGWQFPVLWLYNTSNGYRKIHNFTDSDIPLLIVEGSTYTGEYISGTRYNYLLPISSTYEIAMGTVTETVPFIKSQSNAISNLTINVGELSERVTSLESQNNTVADLTSDVSELSERVTSLESQIENLPQGGGSDGPQTGGSCSGKHIDVIYRNQEATDSNTVYFIIDEDILNDDLTAVSYDNIIFSSDTPQTPAAADNWFETSEGSSSIALAAMIADSDTDGYIQTGNLTVLDEPEEDTTFLSN